MPHSTTTRIPGSRSAAPSQAPPCERPDPDGNVRAVPGASTAPARLSRAALLFLRGRDADARIGALVAERRSLRPALGVLAARFVKGGRHEPLGFRSLGDWARERLGVTAHAVREWARVWETLASLPRLREAVASGEVSWSVARRAAPHAAPETDAAFAAALRGRTVRAADALLRAAFGEAYEREQAAREEGRERVRVSVPLAAAEHPRWLAALELARQLAGESLPVWECAEAIAAEALAALPPACVAAAAAGERAACGSAAPHAEPVSETGCWGMENARGGGGADDARVAQEHGARAAACVRTPAARSREHGLRHAAFPLLRWQRRGPGGGAGLDRVAAWAETASPHGLDAALRRVLRRMQRLDHDLGQLLRQVLDRRLYRELGFTSFERYAEERADLSPRTARRRVRLARLGPAGSKVASAFRAGEITALQASRIAEAAAPHDQPAAVARARAVTLRRLEDELAPASPFPGAVHFFAPPEAASVFHLALAAVALHLEAQGVRQLARDPHATDGGAHRDGERSAPGARRESERCAPGAVPPAAASRALAWMIEHAIAEWTAQGEQFGDYADFTRDGFRCTAPGCTARRSLHSHHIVFRSHHGADEPCNRTTLCAFHHQRGVHAGTVSCHGRAPDGLVFALGLRATGPPLLRAGSGDVLLA